MKQKISFYLEGGGSKCSYQLSMLKHLFENNYFNKNFELESIYGLSFGAAIGYFFLLEDYNISKKLLTENENLLLKSINISSILKFLKIPYLDKILKNIEETIWILYSLTNFGLFSQNTIEKYLIEAKNNSTKNINLKLLNVLVYNINKNKVETIKGDHPLIIDYILASMSVWLLFPPKKINLLKTECSCTKECLKCINNCDILCNCEIEEHRYNEFMDVGFLYTIPIDDLSNKSTNIINCFLLTNPINNDIKISKGNNLLEYLFNIIDTISTKHQNLILEKQNFNKENKNQILHIISNTTNLKTSEINKEKINNNIKKGYKISKKYLRYLKSNNKLNNKILKF